MSFQCKGTVMHFDTTDDTKDRLTLRRLDGSIPGNVRAIRERWQKSTGKGKGRRKIVKENASRAEQAETSGMARNKCLCDIAHKLNPCAFLLDSKIEDVVSRYHVILRFRAGCKEPRNVDGKLAWTTQDTESRKGGCEVRVTYKTKDNPIAKDDFVPLASLEPCVPAMREDEALVICDEDKWKVVYPSHTSKDAMGGKKGMFCKLTVNGKRKDAKLYEVRQLTRIRDLSKGAPVG